jgi:DNA-binding transcriptional ArsR family regulator
MVIDAPFEVLAEPNRRRILDLLRLAERPVGDLVDQLTLSQPAVSKHLRVLREAGLVDVRADAQRRIYRVRAAPLRAIDAWLAPYRQLWESRLDALERHLDTMPDSTMPDSTMPDSTMPDSTMPDSTMPDSTMPDTATAASADPPRYPARERSATAANAEPPRPA